MNHYTDTIWPYASVALLFTMTCYFGVTTYGLIADKFMTRKQNKGET